MALAADDEPARGAEDRVALVVGANGLRRAVGHLHVGARVAQVAHRAQVENRRPPMLADPPGKLARHPEHLCGVVPVRDLVADLLARGERRFDPARRRRDADPEPVVLAHEEQRQREALDTRSVQSC